MIKQKQQYPFSAVVGQDDFKLALILNQIDPLIGGVLAIGDKGTGKTTLIRSLSQLMQANETFSFVNLPIGATEDRLLGNVDLEKLINDKLEVVKPGLLAKANQGILYVDEINLLEDYLTDILLDAAASGGYYLEREGISRFFESRFCLIGSMNPEEGSLRPQLKDRFGLSVNIVTPNDIQIRKKVIEYRLAFEDDPVSFSAPFLDQEKALYTKINAAKNALKNIVTRDELLFKCAELAIEYQVEGLRADILLMRTARAYAAYAGEPIVSESHIYRIAEFVLNHRSSKKSPPSQSSPDDPSTNNQREEQGNSSAHQNETEHLDSIVPENDFQKLNQKSITNTISPRKSQKSEDIEVDLRKSVSQYLATDKFELKSKRLKKGPTEHHIFMIDSSGSMLADKMIAFAKGVVRKIADQNKANKTVYSIISLFDGEAVLQLAESSVLNEVENILTNLKTGGKTNLIAGLKKVKQITTNPQSSHYLNIITDGRFNRGGDIEDAIVAFKTYCKGIVATRLIDTEQGQIKLGMTKEFAQKINGVYEELITENE